jgi:alpha-galactosidase
MSAQTVPPGSPEPVTSSWNLTRNGIQPTAERVPDFPIIRFDLGHTVYQEALWNGQYLGAQLSAMGRAKPRWWIWGDLKDGAASDRPLRTRQHAFGLEVNGQQLVDGWEVVDHHDDTQPPMLRLLHRQRQVEVAVCTNLDNSSFFSRHLVITNVSERPAAIAQVAPWSGLVWELGRNRWDDADLSNFPDGPFSVGWMTESTAGHEGSFAWSKVPPGRWTLESTHGRSGWGMPMILLRNDATGEIAVVNLAWSGNWRIELYNDWEPATASQSTGAGSRRIGGARLYASAAMGGPAPLRVLAPGEAATTPSVHVTAMFAGLDEVVQALHTHIRRSVVPTQPAGREHLVELNHTAFTRNHQVTEAQLYDEIDLAAELGFELFMLDAGWFGGSETLWMQTVGDWDESPLLTKGVRAALDYVKSKGMLAGLWVEPERVGEASRLITEHPDWLMQRRGEQILNLDLSRPEVEAATRAQIVSLIEKYDLDCFRLDYNIDIAEGGAVERHGYTENVLWRHYDALYRIFDQIRAQFPDLLLENCSSGGGRMDLGIMSRFHWTQVTDRWSPAPALRILNGTTLALPPEVTESVTGGISEGVADIDFLIRINLFGHVKISGIAPTSAERNEATWQRWKHAIDLYKNFCRPMLSESKLFHHTPIQRQNELGDWIVLESATPDKSHAFVGIFRMLGAGADGYTFYPRGLDAGRRYRVRYDSAGFDREIDGGSMIDHGLTVRVPSALRSELLLIEAI